MTDDTVTTMLCLAINKINEHVTSFITEKEGVLAADDHEYLHRMRVASRRVRRALDVFYPVFEEREVKVWSDTIRSYTRVLGKARDLDVQIEFLDMFLQGHNDASVRNGVGRVRLRLQQARARQQKKIVRFFEKNEKNGSIQKILRSLDEKAAVCRFTQISSDTTVLNFIAERIQQRLTEFLAFERYVSQPTAREELHEMRICAKFLRYEMEIFDSVVGGGFKPFIQVVKKAQEMLGLLHDCDVWLAYIPDFIEQEKKKMMNYLGHLRGFKSIRKGLQMLFDERNETRACAYAEFVEYWKIQTHAHTWETLYNYTDTLKG